MKIQMYDFQQHGDERGHLSVIEQNKDIPFKIRRVYYLYDTKQGIVRGMHSHKELEQILVCVSGSCKVKLDDGRETSVIVLDDPTKGLYVGVDTWREMYEFSDGAVLLVLASNLYDETDYIRDYDAFKKSIKK